jgi:hypothetical protein
MPVHLAYRLILFSFIRKSHARIFASKFYDIQITFLLGSCADSFGLSGPVIKNDQWPCLSRITDCKQVCSTTLVEFPIRFQQQAAENNREANPASNTILLCNSKRVFEPLRIAITNSSDTPWITKWTPKSEHYNLHPCCWQTARVW